jgi:type IV secretory pathway TraG/TraD family ATPase VirD4
VIKEVPFDMRGFPIFDKFAVVDLRIVDRTQFASVKSEVQMQLATAELRKLINDETYFKGKLLEYYQKGEIGFKHKFTPVQLAAIERGSGRIPGYVWHHHQDFTRMQLVDKDIHEGVRHIGGWQMNICRMLEAYRKR